MLKNELNSLQEELLYHKQAAEELEQKIAEAKSYEAFATEATDAVKSAIEQIGVGKYLWLFREHLMSLFPQEAPKYIEEVSSEEDEIEYMDDSDPDYKSIEEIQQEDPDTVVAVFHSEEHLKEQEEKKEKTYFELTGRPDLRPTTYKDLTPNITYSSSGRAYVGFDSREEAEEFRERLDIPSLLDDAQIMNNHKWEVKFYCDRQYLEELQQELEDDWTPEQKAELDFQERLVRIAPDIFYDGNESSCYLGFRAKSRADNYGSYLTRILNVAEKYMITNNPRVTTNTKYELRLNAIAEEDARHLSGL